MTIPRRNPHDRRPASERCAHRRLAFTATLLAVTLRPVFAQDSPPAPTVRDVAGAERLFAATPRYFKDVPAGSTMRVSPDGARCAWVVDHPGMPTDPTRDAPSDRIELDVQTAAGSLQTVSFDVAHCPHQWACGPVWCGDGVVIGYEVQGKETVVDACVDLLHAGETKALLRQPDTHVRSVARCAAGLIAVATRHRLEPHSSVVILDADGKVHATVDTGANPCESATPSPDGHWLAMVKNHEITVVPIGGGEPVQTAPIARADNDVTGLADVPTWLGDGKSFVVAADGEVVHMDCANGVVHRWPAKALAAVAVDVVVLPGDRIAAAIAIDAADADAADVVLGAGGASHTYHGRLVWLDLQTGAATAAQTKPQRIGRVAADWRRLPHLGAFAAALAH